MNTRKKAKTIKRKRTKKGGQPKSIKKYMNDIKSTYFYKAVKNVFIIIAKINKWNDKYALSSVDEYFILVQTIHKKKNNTNGVTMLDKTKLFAIDKNVPISEIRIGGGDKGGANKLGSFMRWMLDGTAHNVRRGIHMAVGTFDTPCNILLSLIAIGTWSVFAYNYLNNVPAEDARHSLAQPVQYIIYQQYPDAYILEESINDILIAYTANISQRIPIRDIPYVNATRVINSLRTFFWEGALYRTLLVTPISCLLVPVIESCRQNCPLLATI